MTSSSLPPLKIAFMSFILVTGVSGFVGSHVAHRLLEEGYDVTGTVRSGKVAPVASAYSHYGTRFRLAVVEDLVTSDLTAAFQDVYAVIHVGTPLSGPAETVLDGAVRGTKNVLQHAAKAGVARVVVTGSVVSVAKYEDFWVDRLITEEDWNPETYEDAFRADRGFFTTYAVAKTLAERELHAFAAQHPDIDVTSIHPPFIYGPFGPGQSTDLDSFWRLSSNGFLYALISGPPGRAVPPQYPVYPAFVHVGDLARAHVAALRATRAGAGTPRRVLVSGGAFTWAEAVRHIACARPALRARLPRLPAMESDEPQAESPVWARLGVNAGERLGIWEYTGWKETVEETVDDLLRVERDLGLAP